MNVPTYNKGDVVKVETVAPPGCITATRPGIVLSDGVMKNNRYLVLVGLEKIECVVTGDTFIPCSPLGFNTGSFPPLSDFSDDNLASLIEAAMDIYEDGRSTR